MSTYAQRQAQQEASAKVAREVAALGQAQGLWTAKERTFEDHGCRRDAFILLTDTQGIEWQLTAGMWAAEDKVGIRLSSWVRDSISQSPKDSHGATCASSRGAAAILKDIQRRALNNPEAVAEGLAMLERHKQALADRGGLLAQVKALEALGVNFRDRVKPDATHSADGYIKLGQFDTRVSVTRDGALTLHGPIYTTADNLGDIIRALQHP